MHHCHVYIVKSGDTLYEISKVHDVTLNELIAANPQITNPDIIYPGQEICIPKTSHPHNHLHVVSIQFFSQAGVPLPVRGGFVQLAPITIVTVTFSRPVTHGFLFFTPTGTETFLLTQQVGVAVSNGSPTLQFQWQVPPALLGSVFAIGCDSQVCAQSDTYNVVLPE